MLSLVLLCLACVHAQQFGQSVVVREPSTASLAGNCTSAVRDCFLDYFKCQDTTCVANRCVRTSLVDGKACWDMRNASNWDYCDAGLCVGAFFNSSWVQLTTSFTTADPSSDRAYFEALQLRLQSVLGYNGTTLLPMVRTCSERTQRFSGSTTGTPPVLLFQPCAPVFNFVASGNTRQYNIWVELVAGPGTTQTPDQMQTIVVNATNSGVLVPVFAIQRAAAVNNPFDQPPFVPTDAGWRLGVMIGIATGLFLLSLGFCTLFYLVKSCREVGGAFSSSNSSASMQSGSSHSVVSSQASMQSDVDL